MKKSSVRFFHGEPVFSDERTRHFPNGQKCISIIPPSSFLLPPSSFLVQLVPLVQPHLSNTHARKSHLSTHGQLRTDSALYFFEGTKLSQVWSS